MMHDNPPTRAELEAEEAEAAAGYSILDGRARCPHGCPGTYITLDQTTRPLVPGGRPVVTAYGRHVADHHPEESTMPADHARPCEECGTRPGRPMTLAPEGDLDRQRIAYVCEECHR